MPKKDPGTLFMDFQISPEDRVGGTPGKSRKTKPAAAPKTAKKPSAKSGRERTEPRLGRVDDLYGDYEGPAVYEDEKPRRARSERGGRGRGAAKADKVAARPVDEPKAAPAKTPKPRDDRKVAATPKPAPAPRRDDQDGPDDGWNGPMPGFLSVGFGS